MPSYLLNPYIEKEVLSHTFLHQWRYTNKNIDVCVKDGIADAENNGYDYGVVNKSTAGATIADWIAGQLTDEDIHAQIISYCGHYDFVLLLNLFRGDIPNFICPRYYDIYPDLVKKYPDKADDPLAKFDSFTETYSMENALCYASRLRDIYNKLNEG